MVMPHLTQCRECGKPFYEGCVREFRPVCELCKSGCESRDEFWKKILREIQEKKDRDGI